MSLKELKKEIRELKREIGRLEDENNSLWFMLDEFDKSSIQNPEYKALFEEAFKRLNRQRRMTHTKVEEA
tara:strand:- start:546 stop:755 length:210 start_codon:yes stop_codon:yes gene_type:complete